MQPPMHTFSHFHVIHPSSRPPQKSLLLNAFRGEKTIACAAPRLHERLQAVHPGAKLHGATA